MFTNDQPNGFGRRSATVLYLEPTCERCGEAGRCLDAGALKDSLFAEAENLAARYDADPAADPAVKAMLRRLTERLMLLEAVAETACVFREADRRNERCESGADHDKAEAEHHLDRALLALCRGVAEAAHETAGKAADAAPSFPVRAPANDGGVP